MNQFCMRSLLAVVEASLIENMVGVRPMQSPVAQLLRGALDRWRVSPCDLLQTSARRFILLEC